MKKKLIISVILLGIIFSSYLVHNYLKTQNISNQSSFLKEAEFGTLEFVGRDSIPDGINPLHKVNTLLYEDQKYIYMYNESTGNLLSVRVKPKEEKKHASNELIRIDQHQAKEVALDIVAKYYEKNKLVDKVKMDSYSPNLGHTFVFSEMAENGVKTGGSIMVRLDGYGEFRTYNYREGNPNAALSKEAKITKNEALKMAIDSFLKKDRLYLDSNLENKIREKNPSEINNLKKKLIEENLVEIEKKIINTGWYKVIFVDYILVYKINFKEVSFSDIDWTYKNLTYYIDAEKGVDITDKMYQ